MKVSLVVLAAGLGSRYGGLKQMDPVGLNGEAILEYSVYDAIRAGFNHIVFIIRKEMEADFKELIGNKIEKKVEVSYVFQSLNTKMPSWYEISNERKKPWGTGHALLCCKDVLDGPFGIINADDFYGRQAYECLYKFLIENPGKNGLMGYTLENTLTEFGSVTRGLCKSQDGMLTWIKECKKIGKRGDYIYSIENDIEKQLDGKELVSMNMWGFDSSILGLLEEKMMSFLKNEAKDNPLTSEFLIPEFIADEIEEGTIKVSLLSNEEKWMGITYIEDKPRVKQGIKQLVDEGKYPSHLWE